MLQKIKDEIKLKWIILKGKLKCRKCGYYNRPITYFEILTGICKEYMELSKNGCNNCYHCPKQCKIRRKHKMIKK